MIQVSGKFKERFDISLVSFLLERFMNGEKITIQDSDRMVSEFWLMAKDGFVRKVRIVQLLESGLVIVDSDENKS